MKINAKSTILIDLGGQEMTLSREEALVLLSKLKEALGIVDVSPIQNPVPSYPSNPLPVQPYFPNIPDYPNSPKIWCKEPFSTCNT